jgi:hypothetical protein
MGDKRDNMGGRRIPREAQPFPGMRNPGLGITGGGGHRGSGKPMRGPNVGVSQPLTPGRAPENPGYVGQPLTPGRAPENPGYVGQTLPRGIGTGENPAHVQPFRGTLPRGIGTGENPAHVQPQQPFRGALSGRSRIGQLRKTIRENRGNG